MEKFFKERSVFQEQINNIISTDLTKDVIEDLLKLQMAKDAEKNEKMLPLNAIYCLLGPDKFAELVELMDGKTVQFPKADGFRETIQVAVCYYYKYLQNKKWDEIKKILNDEDISSIKIGIKTNNLHQFINKMTQLTIARKKNGKK